MFRSSRINSASEEREYWYNKRRDYEEERGYYEDRDEPVVTDTVPSMNQPPVGSKLEWFSKATSMETHVESSREAHVTEEGIRQTRASNIEPLNKRHTDTCNCVICFINWEGDPKLNPHISSCHILFKDMAAWIESLPKNGTVKVTTVYEFDT